MKQHLKIRISIIRPVAICLALLCAAAIAVNAATITVMNINDSGAGSLRAALANVANGDTIDFDSSLNGQTITLTSGQLEVRKSVTISGPGANVLAVDGSSASRVFYVAPSLTVTVSGLTITSGNPPYGDGAGIFNDHATLTVNNSTISGNSAYGEGGGIYNAGFNGSATLTVNNSTFSGNSAFGGGAIFNDGQPGGTAMLVISNSTVSGNSSIYGGGIYNSGAYGSATLTINNSTLSGNSVAFYGYGGGINNEAFNGSATVTIGHTILKTGASGANITTDSGTVTSLGYNLSNDNGGGFLTATSDQINTDPMLGPLQDNGGPTLTHELLSGSPAIDAGDPNFAPPPNYDQRGIGFARVFNGRVDIGAFEVQPLTPAYAGQVQPPINADGTSAFSATRGVVPVKFNLTQGGVATCDLPPANIAVTRTAGGVTGEVNESVYSGNADTGSNFRIDNCQYVYNLNSRAIGAGTYRVDILINGQVAGSAVLTLN